MTEINQHLYDTLHDIFLEYHNVEEQKEEIQIALRLAGYVLPQEIKGWTKDKSDRITYFDKEMTKAGLPSIDELVIFGANVHLESLSDSCFMLIVDNGKHYWHLNIFSRSSRAKVEAHLYEDNSPA